MRMNNPDIAVFLQEIQYIPPVPGIMHRVQSRADKHPPTQAADLFIVFSRYRFVGQEIKLDSVSVHLPVIIHQHGFDSRTSHIADGMQYTKHLLRFLLPLFAVRRPQPVISPRLYG